MSPSTVHIGLEVGWTPQPIWTVWISENSTPYQDSNSDPSVVQPISSCHTDCSSAVPRIPNETVCTSGNHYLVTVEIIVLVLVLVSLLVLQMELVHLQSSLVRDWVTVTRHSL
jgi:hypothetical protein